LTLAFFLTISTPEINQSEKVSLCGINKIRQPDITDFVSIPFSTNGWGEINKMPNHASSVKNSGVTIQRKFSSIQ